MLRTCGAVRSQCLIDLWSYNHRCGCSPNEPNQDSNIVCVMLLHSGAVCCTQASNLVYVSILFAYSDHYRPPTPARIASLAFDYVLMKGLSGDVGWPGMRLSNSLRCGKFVQCEPGLAFCLTTFCTQFAGHSGRRCQACGRINPLPATPDVNAQTNERLRSLMGFQVANVRLPP